ncbi:hypothetical protein HIM_01033 [Hirsutella minnesotensis 3608]|nr:hypothetical protein HIM_01033 [Hirsutella minnesotensis 3608]
MVRPIRALCLAILGASTFRTGQAAPAAGSEYKEYSADDDGEIQFGDKSPGLDDDTFVGLINATPYRWVRTYDHAYQVESWSWPDCIDPGQSVMVLARRRGGFKHADSAAEVRYAIEGTSKPMSFQVEYREGRWHHVWVRFMDGLETLNNGPGSEQRLGFLRRPGGVGFMLAGAEGGFLSNNGHQLTDGGVRVLDVRATKWRWHFRESHASHVGVLGWQGMFGAGIQEMVDVVNRFNDEHPGELVVVDVHREARNADWHWRELDDIETGELYAVLRSLRNRLAGLREHRHTPDAPAYHSQWLLTQRGGQVFWPAESIPVLNYPAWRTLYHEFWDALTDQTYPNWISMDKSHHSQLKAMAMAINRCLAARRCGDLGGKVKAPPLELGAGQRVPPKMGQPFNGYGNETVAKVNTKPTPDSPLSKSCHGWRDCQRKADKTGSKTDPDRSRPLFGSRRPMQSMKERQKSRRLGGRDLALVLGAWDDEEYEE